MTLFDLVKSQAVDHPDRLAIIHHDHRITYSALIAEVDRIARGLQARGVRHGDRVLTLAGNTPDVVAIYLAVSRLGAIYVPMSTSFREREVRFVLANSEPKVVIVAASHIDAAVSWELSGSAEIIVLGGDGANGLTTFEELGLGDEPVSVVSVGDEDGLLLCYTSGTTSTPKPVLHSQRSEMYNAHTYAEVWRLGPDDKGIVCLPLAWVYGLSTTTAALLVSGGTVVLLDRFHPVEVIDAIEAVEATAMWGTMSMYTKLLEVIKDRGDVDLSSLRVVNNGGEPCPAPLVEEFERHAGVQLLGSYATSEARPIMVVRPGDTEAPEGTSGKLVPGAEIRLVAENGTEIGPGEPGLALLRCPGMMTEYYRQPELTAERLTADGWLRTGDILKSNSDGYWFVVGRQSEMIIRSGVNIAPAEVESALAAHPNVADVAVIGVPDSRSGESIRAYIVAAGTERPQPDELRQFLAGQLAAFKVPQEFVFADELPRTDRGKVDRNSLRRGIAGAEGDLVAPTAS
ncbi:MULTISPECIES: class I adenylate-forming enzyme family protein [unclassified Mycolicibacterium]|uniref:class I adenylate-forming enzyme family protein n=1 Tax=unclassified Mycolicibacterium TaxID=2636767 RepID=UPI001391C48B|nr:MULTISPECIES: class I adenylate-forming enzyme family protein [unclassified Mycolicibacterium]